MLTARMTVLIGVTQLAAWRASNAWGSPAMPVAIRLGASALMVIPSARRGTASERVRPSTPSMTDVRSAQLSGEGGVLSVWGLTVLGGAVEGLVGERVEGRGGAGDDDTSTVAG